MKIVFFGSSNFSTPALKALLAYGCKIICIVTQPDKEKGRGLGLASTPVKEYAKQVSLKVYQPENINSAESVLFLKGLSADIFVVTAYGQLLSKEILSIPKIMSLNAHASLLPKYRGAAPINWAIINGEHTAGVSIMKIVPEMDAGPLLLDKPVDISKDDNAITLEKKLADISGELLLGALTSIENKNYKLIPQDEDKVSFAPKLKKKDGLIDWGRSAYDINNLIRGCIDWPGAFTSYKSKLLKIYRSKVIPAFDNKTLFKDGEVIKAGKEGILVATAKGCLLIEELQIEGKRRMTADEFIMGHRILPQDRFLKN